VSSVSLEWEGLTQLEADLRTLPENLRMEAATITRQAAEDAAATMAALYPKRTGTLATSLQVSESEPGPYAIRAMVTNTARYAYLFDIGTQARHSAIGANRGSMPAGNVFIPTMIRARRAMYAALKDVLSRAGLIVSGDV
jgi:Bacteriophage HK97-gp10, putative tail-component